MDIPELYSIATAIVDYRGYRILCQSIIPGILSQTPENSAKYGSIDDGQTINTDPEFHELMRLVCDKLHIAGSNLLDKEGNPHFLYGALDSKGIRGSDNRKYFLEFLRHTPRDTNFLGNEYSLCLLRPELIDLYTQTKKTEYIEAKVEEELAKKKAENGEEAKLSIEELQGIVQNAPKLAFNPNAFTNASFAEGEEEAKKSVIELGEYLKTKQIPLVASVLCNEEGIWARMGNSLVQVLHKFGVNARYLGSVAAQIQSPQHKNVKWMIERHAVARSVKHVLNAELSNTSDSYLAATISHLLNCLFGLSSYKAEEIKQTKRKRRDKKKKVQPAPVAPKVIQLDTSKPESLNHTSATLWAKIKEYAKRHFSLDLPDSFESWEGVSTSGLRLALLRDICLQIGLTLESTFSWGQSFTEDLISGLGVKIKALDWRSLESRWLHDSAIKTLNEQNVEVGLDMLQQSASIQSQVSGPLHVDIAITYQRLSNIYLSQGDYIQAISYQHRAIVILERVLGPDHTLVGHHYNNFAYLYQILGKFQRALKHYLYALQIFLVNNGELNPEVLSVLTSISLLYGELGHNDTAITVLNQVLEMSTAMYGETTKTADYYQLLAAQHKQLKNLNRAKEYQTRALEILKTCHGAEDARVKACSASLESLDKLESGAELPIPRQLRAPDKNTVLRQKLQARKARAKLGLPRSQTNSLAARLFDVPQNIVSREQIEEQQTRQLIEQISRQTSK
jgi:protein TIF31